MATWPSKFKILKDNFQYNPVSRVISSDMDVGPAKKRRRTGLKIVNVTFAMYLYQEDFEKFMDFYYDNDAVVIDFPRPDNKEIVQARFVSAPTTTYSEPFWQVNVQLEYIP